MYSNVVLFSVEYDYRIDHTESDCHCNSCLNNSIQPSVSLANTEGYIVHVGLGLTTVVAGSLGAEVTEELQYQQFMVLVLFWLGVLGF